MRVFSFPLGSSARQVAYISLVVAETDYPDDPNDFYYWADVVFMGCFVRADSRAQRGPRPGLLLPGVLGAIVQCSGL